AVATTEPSAFARGILNAAPYAFLDDAPLEERRTQAVQSRRVLDAKTADTLGALDPDAVARVRDEAWPQPESAEEAHEALQWMGWITDQEAADSGWTEWLQELQASARVVREPAPEGTHEKGANREKARGRATDATREPWQMLRGRLEALGPVRLAGEGEDPGGRA